MDVDVTLANLFNTMKSPQSSSNSEKKDTTEFEIKKIENQMNTFLRLKQGRKYKRVTLTDPEPDTKALFDDAIDQEILAKFANKKWTSLPVYMKWKLLEEYFKEHNITDASFILQMKKSLQLTKENSQIIYDHVEQKITSIGTD